MDTLGPFPKIFFESTNHQGLNMDTLNPFSKAWAITNREFSGKDNGKMYGPNGEEITLPDGLFRNKRNGVIRSNGWMIQKVVKGKKIYCIFRDDEHGYDWRESLEAAKHYYSKNVSPLDIEKVPSPKKKERGQNVKPLCDSSVEKNLTMLSFYGGRAT